MHLTLVALGLALATPAIAAETKPWSGDFAVTYGRSIGQELNVGGLVGEVKKNIGGHVAMGLRVGGLLGAGMNQGSAIGYAATPVLFKADLFPSQNRRRAAAQ